MAVAVACCAVQIGLPTAAVNRVTLLLFFEYAHTPALPCAHEGEHPHPLHYTLLLRRISYQLHQRAGVHMTTMAYHDTATPIGGAYAMAAQPCSTVSRWRHLTAIRYGRFV